jgi:hypothetical protein
LSALQLVPRPSSAATVGEGWGNYESMYLVSVILGFFVLGEGGIGSGANKGYPALASHVKLSIKNVIAHLTFYGNKMLLSTT